jgi:hypothetical protein
LCREPQKAFTSRALLLKSFKCLDTFTQVIKSTWRRQEVYACLQQKSHGKPKMHRYVYTRLSRTIVRGKWFTPVCKKYVYLGSIRGKALAHQAHASYGKRPTCTAESVRMTIEPQHLNSVDYFFGSPLLSEIISLARRKLSRPCLVLAEQFASMGVPIKWRVKPMKSVSLLQDVQQWRGLMKVTARLNRQGIISPSFAGRPVTTVHAGVIQCAQKAR